MKEPTLAEIINAFSSRDRPRGARDDRNLILNYFKTISKHIYSIRTFAGGKIDICFNIEPPLGSGWYENAYTIPYEDVISGRWTSILREKRKTFWLKEIEEMENQMLNAEAILKELESEEREIIE